MRVEQLLYLYIIILRSSIINGFLKLYSDVMSWRDVMTWCLLRQSSKLLFYFCMFLMVFTFCITAIKNFLNYIKLYVLITQFFFLINLTNAFADLKCLSKNLSNLQMVNFNIQDLNVLWLWHLPKKLSAMIRNIRQKFVYWENMTFLGDSIRRHVTRSTLLTRRVS